MGNKKAPRNKTINLSAGEMKNYSRQLVALTKKVNVRAIVNKTINQDFFEAVKYLPSNFVDLLIVDPPYNLTKNFNTTKFKSKSVEEYSEWINQIVNNLMHVLKNNSSIYFCCDWLSSTSVYLVLRKYFVVRNRITWEREKGRGAKANWKNNTEDIWFCTFSDDYTFNLDAVKVKRKVLAPYRLDNGEPKDWQDDGGGRFRVTHPSNIWTDISVPFWSMRENTDHPTQKPEKLLAKIILASSKPNDIVFDPFLGSGSTSVVSRKLKRRYLGIELDKKYSCIAEKRLAIAENDNSIQGFDDGYFWERNTLSERLSGKKILNE